MFSFKKVSARIFLIIFNFFIAITWIEPSFAVQSSQEDSTEGIPHLQSRGSAKQLIVNGEPFLILGGELGNSSASDPGYLRSIWPKLVDLNLNTVLVPVYWELIELEEGKFNFTLVDSLILNARQYNLHLVLLWFASWKNSMSCYAPRWVKTNPERFPRSQNKDGRGLEILSAFSEANREADAGAFAALMRHVRQVDGMMHTVLMVQVENEVGMIPDSRDRSGAANKAFSKPVPRELMEILQKHKESLVPEFRKVWEAVGFRTSGTWEEVFGKGLGTDEIFMAWHFSRYVNRVIEAGKAEYPLPMFVNAALIRPGYQPGQYPSAGPLPHLMDVWRAGGSLIDFLSPDIYFPNFTEWCQKYNRSGNPLFIPEVARGEQNAARVFYAVGQHDALGFCPFSIESTENTENDPLAKSYNILSQLTPLILEKQGRGATAGVVLDRENQPQHVKLGNYTLTFSHDYSLGWSPKAKGPDPWPLAGGIVISTESDEYVIAGTGIVVTFSTNSPGDTIAGIASIDEGRYENGCWIPGRRLNGDQSHQGRHLRIPVGEFGIQHVRLYRYR